MLACVAWTLPVLFGWRTHFEQGALTKAALWSGEHWRLGTAILLHYDLLHVSLNVLSLYFVGRAESKVCYRFFQNFFQIAEMVNYQKNV